MSTRRDLFAAIDAAGLPWCNETWEPETPPALPYVVVCAQADLSAHADNRTARATSYRLELYSHGRDYATEEALTDAMDAAGIPWGVQAGGILDAGADVYQIQLICPVMGA